MTDTNKCETLIRRYADLRVMASRGSAIREEVTQAWFDALAAIAAAPERPTVKESLTTAPTDDEIRTVAEKHYGTCMTAQELTFARAILAQFSSPAEPLDREAIRNEAMDEAAESCLKVVASKDAERFMGKAAHYAACADAIRALKSQPAQQSGNSGELPSDSQAEPSDTALKAALIAWHETDFSGIGNPFKYRMREAIKAAMRADKEGS